MSQAKIVRHPQLTIASSTRPPLTRDDIENYVIEHYEDKIKSLEDGIEKRDFREVMLYQTVRAAIILLDDGESTQMVADMLRLARDSMSNAAELIKEVKAVSHA